LSVPLSQSYPSRANLAAPDLPGCRMVLFAVKKRAALPTHVERQAVTDIHQRDELVSAGDLTLWSRTEGDAAIVVTARGEIDMASAPALRDLLLDLIDQGCRRLVLSMAAVTFMDSTGLGALIAARKHMRHHNGLFRLVRLNSGPAKVMQITGLADVFPTWDTAEDALSMT
jgi:anti-sigma B factor antagonist